MIYFNILNVADYAALRFNIIFNAEENRIISMQPYLDSSTPPIPTIGIGFNLQVNMATVARAIAPTITDSQIAQLNSIVQSYIDLDSLTNNLNAKMALFNSANPAIPAVFAFANNKQVQQVFDTIAPTYENKVDVMLLGIPLSSERAALFSLGYNQRDDNPLLGQKLGTAITNNNRPEAWYQIRYKSNGGQQKGIAKRRYYESQIFGLYDDANNPLLLSYNEASKVDAMYTIHRKTIEDYDNIYVTQVDKANKDYDTTIVQSTDAARSAAGKVAYDQIKQQTGLPLTGVFTPLSNEIFIATPGSSTDLTDLGGDGIILGDTTSASDITVYDTVNFGTKFLIDDNGRLIFGGQEISGTAIEATNQPGSYILRMDNNPNIFVIKRISDDARIAINDFSDSPASSLTLNDYFVGNDNGQAGTFGIIFQNAPEVKYTLGEELTVDTTTFAGTGELALTGLSNGCYAVVWKGLVVNTVNGAKTEAIFGQTFKEDGSVASDKFKIAEALINRGSVYRASITSLESGRFAVAWTQFGNPITPDKEKSFLQIYNSDGSVHTGIIITNDVTLPSHIPTTIYETSICSLGDNRIQIVNKVTDENFGNGGIYGQVIDVNGNIVVPSYLMLEIIGRQSADQAVVPSPREMKLTSLGNEKFVAVWTQPLAITGLYRIAAQLYDVQGIKIGNQFEASNDTSFKIQNAPYVTALNNGNFAVAWTQYQGSNTFNIASQVFNSAGMRIGSTLKVTNDAFTTGIINSNPSMIATSDGGFLLARIKLIANNNNIYTQKFDSTGNMVGSPTLMSSTINYSEHLPIIAGSPNGDFCLAWYNSYTNGISEIKIKIQKSNLVVNAIGGLDATIIGTARSDSLIAPSSGTVITGGGADTIISLPNPNTIVSIPDFDPSIQQIDLRSQKGITGMGDFNITKGSAVIHLPNNQTIHVDNADGTITPANLTADNFIFAPVNHAPVAKIDSISAVVPLGMQAFLNASSYFSDPDRDTLNYSIFPKNNITDLSWISQDPYSGIMSGIVTEIKNYTGDIVATDPDGLSVSVPFNIIGAQPTPTSQPSISSTRRPSPSPTILTPSVIASKFPTFSPSVGSLTVAPTAGNTKFPTSSPSLGSLTLSPVAGNTLFPTLSPITMPSFNNNTNHNSNSPNSNIFNNLVKDPTVWAGAGGFIGLALLTALGYAFRKELSKFFCGSEKASNSNNRNDVAVRTRTHGSEMNAEFKEDIEVGSRTVVRGVKSGAGKPNSIVADRKEQEAHL